MAVVPPVWSFWADKYASPGVFTPVGPVQCNSFTATMMLSDFGSGSAGIIADTCSLTDTDLLNLWGWRLFAFRDGVPVWCGMPTGVSDSGDLTVPVTLTEITGYLSKRVQDTHTLTFGQQEQTAIAAFIASELSQVGMTVSVATTAPILRDRTYQVYEDTMGTLLVNLSQVINGPQFRTQLSAAATPGLAPSAVMRIAYPRVGSDTGLGITVPGSSIAYSATWDADQLRTHTVALGAVPDTAAANAARPVYVLDQPRPNIPRLDAVDDWSTTILTTTLNERAHTSAAQYAVPVLSLTATADAGDPPLGSYGVGDTVTVSMTSPLLAGGLDVTGTLTQMDIDATADTVNWTVAVPVPAPQPRQTLIQRLATISRNGEIMFRRNARGVLT